MVRELDILIAEQAKDDTSFQPREPGTVSLTTMIPFLSNEGLRELPRALKGHPECALHGRKDLKFYPNVRRWQCAECNRISSRGWAARNRETARARAKAWREKNRDRRNTYEREYKARRYKEDSVYREREKARNRKRRQG